MLWVCGIIAVMEDPKWLRLVTIGLVLAALAVGYFLLTGRLASNSATKKSTQISQASPTVSPVASASPFVAPLTTSLPTSSPTPVSAYNQIAGRAQTKGGAVLPNTGFPAGPLAILAVSAVITGWGLRKFPH